MAATGKEQASTPAGARAGHAVPELLHALGRLCDERTSDGLWPERLRALQRRVLEASASAPDELLFLLIAAAARMPARYGVHHALACAPIVGLAAQVLGWPEDERQAVVNAALTMNLSITSLQDELAHRERTLTVEQRRAVEAHPGHSAERLRAFGVEDALWLETVALHHAEPDGPLAALPPAHRLAALLRRVDVFLAKISPRAGRPGLPTTQAARDACLAADGKPDTLGAAIVWQRGARLHQPLVLGIAGADRQPWVQPLLRRTADAAHAIKGPAGRVESRIPWDPQTLFDTARSLSA
jgi:hypothetical protein